MIVPTMTDEQIKNEVRKDLVPILYKFESGKKAYRRKILKTKAHTFPVITETEFVSPRSNKWLLYQLSEHKREFEGKEKRKFVCIAHDHKGRKSAYEFNISTGGIIIFRFSAHFFDRYKERMKLAEKGDDVIKTYFRRNKSYMIGTDAPLFSENGKYETVIFTEDGVGLGVLRDGMILIATFLPVKYFSKTQREYYKHFEEYAIPSWQTRYEMHQDLIHAGVRPMRKYVTQ